MQTAILLAFLVLIAVNLRHLQQQRRILERLRHCRPRRDTRVLILGGSAGVNVAMLTKNPGDTFTLTAVYTDKNGKTEPLATLPVCTEASGVATSPVGSPTVNDAQFQFTGTVPVDAAAGSTLDFTITAEGDPTPGVDTLTGTFQIGVVALEDTNVTITGQ